VITIYLFAAAAAAAAAADVVARPHTSDERGTRNREATLNLSAVVVCGES